MPAVTVLPENFTFPTAIIPERYHRCFPTACEEALKDQISYAQSTLEVTLSSDPTL